MAANSPKQLLHKLFFKGLLLWEKRLAQQQYELRYSPVFLVAPPRAGTTLTRQLIAWALPTSYLTNLLMMGWRSLKRPLPLSTARLVTRFGWHHFDATFESNYGYTEGRGAPAEAEPVWDYWFGVRYTAVSPDQLSLAQKTQIYQAVAGTEHAFGYPFVNKTTVLSLRIRALVDIFPNALFINIVRDPLDTAQSIYRARKSGYDRWLGPKPPQCKPDGQPVWQQVCDQVYYTEQFIAQERAIVGDSCFLDIHYKSLCAQPRQEIARIARFMNEHGAPVPQPRQVPASFRRSHGRKVDEEVYAHMCDYLRALYGADGNGRFDPS
ncbi:MAG: sulfotransferase [Chloroflexi bacterium]|nr:MAG: sulfotransferase [Chloroflexota bacterium]